MTLTNSQIKKYIRIIAIVIIFTLPIYLIMRSINVQTKTDEVHYVGKESCIECHYNEYKEWEGSHHDLAMAHANDSTVRADFNDAELTTLDGVTHRFFKKDGKFYVNTVGAKDELEDFEVLFTFGWEPLQQYLVEFPGGRLQCLQLTWNTLEEEWYSLADELYAEEDMNSDNWLFWTNQAQNWNSMCADCHSTNLQKNYDVDSDTYNTTYSEINVSCEACHGPASKHIEWANIAEYARPMNSNYGLIVKTSGVDNKAYVDNCARCHTRRASISDYKHSDNIYNHMMPSLPDEPLYHVDGQILDEDYVYGSFTQSKMYMRDVQCNDCHNVHSTDRLFEDNRLCTQCHRADDYDTPDHHFHKNMGENGEAVTDVYGISNEVGSGAKCINCHMPQQPYMGVDFRADHSMRVPRPRLTKELGTPNACNQCHAEESTEWAISYIEKWYGESRKHQYGSTFRLANDQKPEGFAMLKVIYDDEVYPEILRALSLQKMVMFYPDSSRSILYDALVHPNDHIRYNAVRNYFVDSPESISKLLPLLKDGTKSIRIEAADKLYVLPKDQIPKSYKKVLDDVLEERLEALEYNGDFPGGKFNLGNFYYNTGNLAKAEEFYARALKQDPLLHSIKVNLAYVYNQQGKFDDAEKLFISYLESEPADGNVMFSYGLFLSERGRYEESLEFMLKASELNDNNVRVFYNIAMMYDFFKNNEKTELYLKLCIQKDDANISYYSALLNHYIKTSQNSKVKSTAQDILNKFPDLENRADIEALLK